MLRQIKNLLKKHKDNFLVNKLWQFKQKLEDRKVIKRLQKLKPVRVIGRKIRVLFVVVDSNTWNKIKSLYLAMKSSAEIDLYMVCCPEPYKKDTAKTYNFFLEQGYDCIDARIGEGPWNALEDKGEWFDIKKLRPDYIFYTEPYNGYLPPKYRSNITSSYAKVCIVTYGMTTTKEFLAIRPREFYRDVYLCYANSEDQKKYNIEQFKCQHQQGLQHTKYFGFLTFCDIMNQKEYHSAAWNFSRNKVRAIWTPRWTLDEIVGGSNFFRYKDILFNYAKQNPEIDFLFRPHPMALDNFLRTGKMTQKEVDEFIAVCEKEKNLNLDTQPEYIATFWRSDFLVTDISTIIVEYFVTGKPIIFCKPLHTKQTYLPYFAKILDACYVVNDEKELLAALDYLKTGQDAKQERRKRLITEIFSGVSMNAPRDILNDILQDAKCEKVFK